MSTPRRTRTEIQQGLSDEYMDILPFPSADPEPEACVPTSSYLPSQNDAISTPTSSTQPIHLYPETATSIRSPLLSPEPASSPSVPVEKKWMNEIPMDALLKLKNEANSRRNFALKQAERMFTYDERLTSNCQGKRGKKQLDKKRLEVIRENTLKLWPLENKEDEGSAWHDCRRAIDEGGRQLNHRVRLQTKTFV